MTASVTIRDADVGDLPAIVGLLNALIATTTYEYTESPHTVVSRTLWFDRQCERRFPVIVAELDGQIVGFASYGDFRDSIARSGFRHTAEHTVHVDQQRQGRGIARSLMKVLIERAAESDVHVLIGAIDSTNVGSIVFHERLGFVEVGRLPEAARKFDRWCDLVLMQLTLDPTSG